MFIIQVEYKREKEREDKTKNEKEKKVKWAQKQRKITKIIWVSMNTETKSIRNNYM